MARAAKTIHVPFLESSRQVGPSFGIARFIGPSHRRHVAGCRSTFCIQRFRSSRWDNTVSPCVATPSPSIGILLSTLVTSRFTQRCLVILKAFNDIGASLSLLAILVQVKNLLSCYLKIYVYLRFKKSFSLFFMLLKYLITNKNLKIV